jgi:hypothetical protein
MFNFIDFEKGSENRMARGGLDYEGIGALRVPFKVDATTKAAYVASGVIGVEGMAVALTEKETCGFGNAGDALLGKLEKYETDGHATVQVAGFTEFTGVSGSLPNFGNILVVDGNGAVMASAGAAGSSKAINIGSEVTGPVMVFIG